MAYTTPHHAREWFFAASLQVCHEYAVRAQYRPKDQIKAFLEESKEIDLHWRLAAFFGTAVNVSANGPSEIDVVVNAPRLDAEVKYLVPGRSQQAGVQKDWDWLLGLSNVNQNFTTSAWVVFFPTIDYYDFTECHSVKKPISAEYDWGDIAPFLPIAEPFMPPQGTMQKLKWRSHIERVNVIRLAGGKKVRTDIVGDPKDPLWAAVYTRITPSEYKAGSWPADIRTTDKTVQTGPDQGEA